MDFFIIYFSCVIQFARLSVMMISFPLELLHLLCFLSVHHTLLSFGIIFDSLFDPNGEAFGVRDEN